MQTHSCAHSAATASHRPPYFEDPLGADASDDVAVLTTRRGLSRLALVAAETAARFERRGIGHEPMAWMLTPRRMFDGVSAVEACLDREACARAVLLHRLDEGLDGDPVYLDWLGSLDDDGFDGFDEVDDVRFGEPLRGMERGWFPEKHTPAEVDPAPIGRIRPATVEAPDPSGAPRLFTAVVNDGACGGYVQAFAAAVVGSRASFRASLTERYGDAGSGAMVIEGFDPSDPLVGALVSPAMAHVLEQVAVDPGSPLAEGLDVRIEQRFAA